MEYNDSNSGNKINKRKNQVYENLSLEGRYYEKFLNAIKSEAAKTAYITSLKRYMDYLQITDTNTLMGNPNPEFIEDQIIEYIKSLNDAGISYNIIKF